MTRQLLLPVCGLALLMAVTTASPRAEAQPPPGPRPQVAVLVEPGMVVYGGTPSMTAQEVADNLSRLGFEVTPLTAEQTADPAVFSREQYAALVMPHGNAFPEPAFAAIRRFHAGGGVLVTNGVPFCHPCTRDETGEWRNRPDTRYLAHDSFGMGTGGFGGPYREGETALQVVEGNPLGLRSEMLPLSHAAIQWLAPTTLAPEDRVIPLVNAHLPTYDVHPVTALVVHDCDAFNGAVDVWLGQTAHDTDEHARYFALQVMARGLVWSFAHKGLITAEARAEAYARFDRVQPPAPLPSDLAYTPAVRPWGESFLPKSPPPAERLMTVNMAGLSDPEKIALLCLQGLTSRTEPRIWCTYNWTDPWLDWHLERGHIQSYADSHHWQDLFRLYRDEYRGAIIPDPDLYRGDLLAVPIAACEDLIVTTPELARSLEIPVVLDLRGRFSTYAEGLRWVWDTYRDQLNPAVCKFMHPGCLSRGAFAYEIQWRILPFWIVGPVDRAESGTDLFAERRIVAEILAELPANTAILGFPYFGEGVGPGEVNGVAFAGRYAKPLVCTDFLANACVMSGIRIDRLEQPAQPPAPELEPDKVYIALVMSDGDNQNTWGGFFKGYFDHPAFGTFPLAFGMGPPILDLMPGIAEWYFRQATPTTEFVSDVSGIGYMQPDNYGTAYRDRDAVLREFLDWTGRYMTRLGMRTVRPVRADDDMLRRYIDRLPFTHSIFSDMGRYGGEEGVDECTYRLEGKPVFRAVTTWRYGKDGFLDEVREQVGDRRPAFVNGFVHCWTFDMDSLARIYAERDPDMVFVTPTQLADLYNQTQARP